MGAAKLVSGRQMVELSSLDRRCSRQATEENQRQGEQKPEREGPNSTVPRLRVVVQLRIVLVSTDHEHAQLVRGRRNVVVVWHC
jgi:hypothetical protein